MNSKNKQKFKVIAIIALVGVLIGGGVVLYLFNMPHRDVQETESDYTLKATDIVKEYLSNPQIANDKYLDAEGESKILEVEGTISSITEDFNNQKVILLKPSDQEAGVSCTFTAETNQSVTNLIIGQKVTVKGVIRSGASYDEDLEMYENVIMEKCDIVTK